MGPSSGFAYRQRNRDPIDIRQVHGRERNFFCSSPTCFHHFHQSPGLYLYYTFCSIPVPLILTAFMLIPSKPLSDSNMFSVKLKFRCSCRAFYREMCSFYFITLQERPFTSPAPHFRITSCKSIGRELQWVKADRRMYTQSACLMSLLVERLHNKLYRPTVVVVMDFRLQAVF